MTDVKQRLLDRLDAIGQSLAASGRGVALIGLGSVGFDTDRIDDASDLDFFAIVFPGAKAAFLDDLAWLAAARPVAWSFRNTVDGYKALFDDGVFAEFAVFEPRELTGIPFATGRVVWKADGVDAAIATPRKPLPDQALRSKSWLIGEALSNLLIGLRRYRRGERLAAMRLVQGAALDRVVELFDYLVPAPPGGRDPFALERRVERRYPVLSAMLPSFAQGLDRTPESAEAILTFLESSFAVDAAIAEAIRSALARCHAARPAPAAT